MKKYIYLAHTADAKFRAFGPSLEQAFKNAAYAMTDIITDIRKIKSEIKQKISVKSEDEKALLYDFLEKLLILLDTKRFLLSKVKKIRIKKEKKGFSLKAMIAGDNHPEKYQTKTTIKAVTYQEMLIERKKGKFMLQVVVDI
jgi:SHS2 domain-containing protein